MPAANGLTALVVDDNAHARRAAAAALGQLGLGRIVEADSGATALAYLSAERFDLLVTDWYMPRMSGASLIEVLRESRFDRNSSLPVLVMTAYPSRETLLEARRLGVREVLVKPLTADELALALRRVLPEAEAPTGDDGGRRVFL